MFRNLLTLKKMACCLFAYDSIEKDKLHLVSRYFLVLNGRVCVVMLFIRFL